ARSSGVTDGFTRSPAGAIVFRDRRRRNRASRCRCRISCFGHGRTGRTIAALAGYGGGGAGEGSGAGEGRGGAGCSRRCGIFILSELTATASRRQLVCAEKENALVCPETVLLKLFSSPAPVSLAEREPDNVPIIGNSRA